MLDQLRICIVSASGQNVFFAEILEAFASALREHGVAVEESVDCFPPPSGDLVYLFIPHEYNPMVHEPARPTTVQLRRSIALCTEQPGTSWFDTAAEIAAEAGAAVDINALGARELVRRGIPAEHVPLGYVPAWDRWHGREDARPIDLTFLGAHTERRARTLARCAPALAGRRSAIHLVETFHPHVAGSSYFLSRDAKWELLAGAKVLLNVHHGSLAYMEWHRVLGAVLNGCVVLSEHSLETAPFEPGEHFVSARYEDLPNALDGLLSDPGLQRRVQQAAYDLVREQMPMDATVATLLRAAERAAGAEVPAADRSRPAPPPLPKLPPPRKPEWEAHAEWLGDELPVRRALKELLVRTTELSRQVGRLSERGAASPTVERFGPERRAPRVSVLLTLYNYADLVGDALRSVALSDLREVEVIVVDDGSTDHSADAVRDACVELPWLAVRLLGCATNSGLPAARNLALAHAGAELVFVLDADNMVLPAGLRILAAALDERPDAAFAYGLVETFDAAGPQGLMNWLDWDPKRLRHGNYVDAMAMIRRAALQGLGGYPTDRALSLGWEDFAVWIAMADAGMDGVRVPDFVARYRKAPHSMISITDIDHSAAWATLLRKYPSLAAEQAPA